MITACMDNGPDTTDTASGRLCTKTSVYLLLNQTCNWTAGKLVLGVETGVGYALSDENNSIGLGFYIRI
jgi:hypothetical protein